MGKDTILTKEQKIIFSEIQKSDFIRSNFYFTGGTALSEVYLKHRQSEDLDFFSAKEFDRQFLLNTVTSWSKKYNLDFESQLREPTSIYIINFGKGIKVKIDFSLYPYKSLGKKGIYRDLEVDSELDIAVNKLLLVASQRLEIKDYVDLYFLLKKYSIWDLIRGVEVKFRMKVDPFLLASDYAMAEDFNLLPKMLLPLNLDELKDYFRNEAKKLAKKHVV